MRNYLSPEFEQLSEQLQSTQIGFLLTDLDVGSTFARMAMESSDADTRARTTRKARQAYEAVSSFLSAVALKPSEAEDIRHKLASLKSDLQRLGETF